MLAGHSLRSPQCEEERRCEAVFPFKTGQIISFGQSVSPGVGVAWGRAKGGFPLRRFPAGAFSAGEESGAIIGHTIFFSPLTY